MEILSSLKEVHGNKAFWERVLLEDEDATIFQTWGWNYSWICQFLGEKKIYIIIDRELNSIAPFYLRNWGNLKILDFIGTRGSDYLDIISPSTQYRDFLAKVFKHFRDSEFDILNLEDFRENSKKESIIKKLAISMDLYHKELDWCPSCSINLNDDYKDILSKKVLRGYRSRKKHMISDYGDFSIINGNDEDLDLHYGLHQKRFASSWSGGTYSNKKTKLFMKNFYAYLLNSNLLHFKVLLLRGNHVASILGGKLNNKVFIYTTALNHKFKKYGVGKILYIEDILESEKEGCEIYDLMRGNEKYKKEIGCKETMNKKIVIAKREGDLERYLTYYESVSKGYSFGPSMF
jgi:CelD/BcsL family acetyltransferase involved in cellulose biosynthesis